MWMRKLEILLSKLLYKLIDKFNKKNKRHITWDDAVANYKDQWKPNKTEQDNTKEMTIFHGLYNVLLS